MIFQAVFAWATPFADALDGAVSGLIDLANANLPAGFVRDLLTQGILSGVGSVIVFLPQIVILFAFILVMEQSGYMARVAMMPGIAQAKLDSSGMKLRPERPT